jgi:catechol 2,3-dioxygenase-like lactoylglutathione lyase family enzyme
MEHVGIVVDDLEAATAFFVELGLKLQGEGQGSSVASPGCRRFRSRDDTTAIVTPRVALRSRSHERPTHPGQYFFHMRYVSTRLSAT